MSEAFSVIVITRVSPFSSWKYSLDALPQEIPGSGVGDFRDDMIEIRHADGSFAADFRFDSFEISGSFLCYSRNAGAVRYRGRKR